MCTKKLRSAWLLKFQAVVSNILREASPTNGDKILSELYSALDHGERLIQEECNKLHEMANIRGKRQKTVLLEKASCCVECK